MGIPGQFSPSLLRFHNTSYQCHLQEHSSSRACFRSERRNTDSECCFPLQVSRSVSRSTAVPVCADRQPPVVPGGWTGIGTGTGTGIGTGKAAVAGGSSHLAPSGGCRGSHRVTAGSLPTRAPLRSRQCPKSILIYMLAEFYEMQLRAKCRSASLSCTPLGALLSPVDL